MKNAAGDFLLYFYLSPLLKSLQAGWNFTARSPADSGSKVVGWSRKILETQNDLIFVIDPLGSYFISGLGSCHCLSEASLKGHP